MFQVYIVSVELTFAISLSFMSFFFSPPPPPSPHLPIVIIPFYTSYVNQLGTNEFAQSFTNTWPISSVTWPVPVYRENKILIIQAIQGA